MLTPRKPCQSSTQESDHAISIVSRSPRFCFSPAEGHNFEAASGSVQRRFRGSELQSPSLDWPRWRRGREPNGSCFRFRKPEIACGITVVAVFDLEAGSEKSEKFNYSRLRRK